ncbi:MAG: alpha/beta hydrolase [bacterium]|nr:alpha/beta hydrolase [bacterium]
MLKVLLLLLALLAALVSLLTLVRAPDYVWTWKLAIAVSEFGHWLVLLPLALALVACLGSAGAGRIGTLILCGLATTALLRPAFSAWRLDPGAFSWARLYAHASPAPVMVRTEVFARPEGQELQVDFYSPAYAKDVREKPRPCLVVIHGGGWDGGDRTQLAEWNARFVAQGWAVAAVSYRLAPQFIWPAQRDDVLAAVAWLKANAVRLGIDPTRLVLLGRSAGGQLAAAVGYGAHDPAIRGVIALYAPHDMPFAWSVSREDDALNSIKLMRQYFGGPPDTPERRARYESASGQLLATKDSPPTLLIHGVPDTLSWYRHSERLAARLRELGVAHTHLQLPWATHGFDFNPDGPGGQLADHAIAQFLAANGPARRR